MSSSLINLNKPGAVEDLLAFHRGLHGHTQMNANQSGGDNAGDQTPENSGGDAGPERPDGISEDDWSALGDPGKRALVRERERATRAEHDLAAARAAAKPKPTPPPKKDGDSDGEKPPEKPAEGDIAGIVQQAVAAAIAPFQQAQAQREAEDGARRIAEAVTTAAKTRLHDASDALAYIDLTGLTDGSGSADAAKITAALDDLVTRKPHLARDDRRRPPAGSHIGASTPPSVSADDQVKAALAQMQNSIGISVAE